MLQLVLYIKDFAEEFLNEFEYEFHTNKFPHLQLEKIQVSNNTTRQIIFILKEALTNAVKHSEGKKILLWAEIESDSVKISLSDDGKGLPENPDNGMGLCNMKKRAEKIMAQLEIDSKPEKGTSIYLTIPLKHV